MAGRIISKIAEPLLIGALLAIVAIMGCSKDKSTSPNTAPPIQHSSHYHAASIAGFAFSPAVLSIPAGDTVIWTNNDSAPHTVTSDSGTELNSPSLGRGQTFTHIFATVGSLPYHCSIHPSMRGGVTVR
jgi:plastocyanin